MPQLPSGQHVAIDPTALLELIERAESGESVPCLYLFREVRHLFDAIRIIYLAHPKDLGTRQVRRLLFADKRSLPLPAGHVVVHSGFVLSKLDEASRQWPAADRVAFASFLRESRTNAFLDELFARLLRARDRMATS